MISRCRQDLLPKFTKDVLTLMRQHIDAGVGTLTRGYLVEIPCIAELFVPTSIN